MYSQFNNIEIISMAACLPDYEIDNMDFCEQYGEKVVKRQIKVTGISKRRVVKEGQNALDLMLYSAEKMLKNINWQGSDIDVLIFASGYEVCKKPATAYLAQKQLGIKEDCLIYDINLACTGTVDGLYTISALLQNFSGNAKGLLLVGETTTVGGAEADQTVRLLSSDCGVAVAVEKRENSVIQFGQHTDGLRYDILVRQDINDYIHMDGMKVFEFAITDVVTSINDFWSHFNIDKKDIDYFVIHQAQKFIVDKVRFFSDLPDDKIINSYHLYGNTGGASDICTVCANVDQMSMKQRIRFFMTGFGAGLSWAMIVFEMNAEGIMPIQYTNKHYEI